MTTTMLVRSYHKTVVERRMLYIDYTCWLEEAEKLTDSQVTIAPYTADAPLTVTTGYTDATQKKLTMFVGGGKGNVNYVLSLVVRTDLGQIKRDDIGVSVKP